MYNGKLNITEEESRRIRKLYSMKSSDYVFDMVLTENNKYLIFMDNVFVNGGDGNSIGSIWDNTYIFNEIIKESYNKLGLITEDIENKIKSIEGFIWDKELVKEVINSKNQLSEGIWDALKTMGQAGVEAYQMLKNGLISFLRWVRRGLYTNIGIVIDVVVSILAVKSSAIVWLVIILLDIYEIITGKFDPEDPDREASPYLLLCGDLLGVLFTGAVALPFKKVGTALFKGVAKEGAIQIPKNMLAHLNILYKQIPNLKSSIKSVGNLLIEKMSSSKNIINVILGGVDKVLNGLQTFIHKLLSAQGAKAVATGGAVLGTIKGVGAGIEKIRNYNNDNKLDMTKIMMRNPNSKIQYTDQDFDVN
jgi:hypothetical protein